MEAHKRECRQCELKAVLAGLTKESIEAIAIQTALDKGYNVDEDLFYERMEKCQTCENLVGGVMCRQSGFYIAAKAIDKNAACPNPLGPRW